MDLRICTSCGLPVSECLHSEELPGKGPLSFSKELDAFNRRLDSCFKPETNWDLELKKLVEEER